MRNHPLDFQGFFPSVTVEDHARIMSRDGEYGDNPEIQAIADAMSISIEVYANGYNYLISPRENVPIQHHIRIFHANTHYQAVVPSGVEIINIEDNSSPSALSKKAEIVDLEDEEVVKFIDDNKFTEDCNEERLALAISVFKKYQYKIIDVEGDGNCLFRAVAEQLEGMDYASLRQIASSYVTHHPQDFLKLILKDTIEEQIAYTQSDRAWGGRFEFQAIADALGINIHVSGIDGYNVYSRTMPKTSANIMIIFTGNHYMSVLQNEVYTILDDNPLPVTWSVIELDEDDRLADGWPVRKLFEDDDIVFPEPINQWDVMFPNDNNYVPDAITLIVGAAILLTCFGFNYWSE